MADQLTRFQKRLAAIPKRMIEAAQAANHRSADELVASMKSLAPVDSGALRDSIHSEPGDLPTQVRIVAGGEATMKEVRSGSGAPYDYAKGVEFGTRDTPAQPYFLPSFRLLKPRMERRAKRNIGKAAKDAWKEGK